MLNSLLIPVFCQVVQWFFQQSWLCSWMCIDCIGLKLVCEEAYQDCIGYQLNLGKPEMKDGWSKFGTGGNGGYVYGDSVGCGGIGRGLCAIEEESTCCYYW